MSFCINSEQKVTECEDMFNICPLLDSGNMTCGKNYTIKFNTSKELHYSENCKLISINIKNIDSEEYFKPERDNFIIDVDPMKLKIFDN